MANLLYTARKVMHYSRNVPEVIRHIYAELTALDDRIDDVEAGTVAAGSISSDELANGAVIEAKLGTGAVTSGKLGSNAVTQLKIDDDAVGAAELKIVERNITIAGGAASGSVTNAADINGTVIGVIPYAACESAIKDVSFTTGTGAITVELLSAQTAEVPATVTALILQA